MDENIFFCGVIGDENSFVCKVSSDYCIYCKLHCSHTNAFFILQTVDSNMFKKKFYLEVLRL